MPFLDLRHWICGVAATMLSLSLPIWAQGNPLRIIVPASAGSGQDVMVRSAQYAMSKSLGRPVVVENLPGSGGIIGTQQLVKAAPDGNTIAFVSNNHVVNPAVYKKMPYDSLKDITPIAVLAETPFVLVVNPKRLPAGNLKELVALIKAKPDQYNFGSSGNGTILHLAAETFLDAAGLKARHIPYKGVGPMTTDLIGGQVDFAVLSVPSVQAHLKAGTLRAIAATGATRVPSLANVPTLQEQGINVSVGGWLAAIGPAGLPAAEVKRLRDGIVAAWMSPEVKKAMAEQENILRPSTSEEAAALFAREQRRYAALVRKTGVTLD
ncbi:Bug family tripartite tricarboxylate transporter substrate binding protein [Cupriavidus lacunae]|uniref:Tripartite tricarboxylate transporter substrate binding protein n=1 Tax=Cupriavidus lacunae TaxID=2666307 RepID=A0A370NJ77_9BURK|nr:tripartite tricarboxylate transporter substrate binding protein [Cupriavidus lacunae]RDK05657.1 tripartite tricarboxylate transporter substrate binding protein [Cupriavidus lacunae]